jgi:hypothetical protein
LSELTIFMIDLAARGVSKEARNLWQRPPDVNRNRRRRGLRRLRLPRNAGVAACVLRIDCRGRVTQIRRNLYRLALAIGLALAGPAAAAETGWHSTTWGESSEALARQFGAAATRLARPIDFGDSYADLVLKNYRIGDYGFVVFFQMDKKSHGLKRIQIERGRHGAVPQVAKAAFDALVALYGPPSASCASRAHTIGTQNLVERVWQRDDTTIRALFREASLNTLDPYLARDVGDFVLGTTSIGLSQQLLIRIAPAGTEPNDCRPARDHAK